MAIPTFNAIGFCAHYSLQGDWAFDFALELSKAYKTKLNVFHFLQDPYGSSYNKKLDLTRDEIENLVVKKEKELRLYYDERAGEYLDVGFRVCYDHSWTELHRCLLIREFQLLVLAVPENDSTFAQKPIKDFSDNFISPVILIGPKNKDQIYMNTPAKLISENLEIFKELA